MCPHSEVQVGRVSRSLADGGTAHGRCLGRSAVLHPAGSEGPGSAPNGQNWPVDYARFGAVV